MPGSQLNIVLFFETLGKIVGNRHNFNVELSSVEHKETGEVIYSNPKNEIKGGRRVV